jgi:hypothetical protein
MAQRNSVRDIDKGAKKVVRSIRKTGKKKLFVGIQGKEAEQEKENGITVAMVAAFAEFGLGNNPERSWLRAWVDENKTLIENDIRKVSILIAKGKLTEEKALEILGLKFVGEIQRRIASGIDPPNAESTVARKGSSTPLIDSGQFRGGITHKVGT